MIYRLFLYKMKPVRRDICTPVINRALSDFSSVHWKNGTPDNYIENFDAENIVSAIEKVLCKTKNPLCKVSVRMTPKGNKKFITVTTSYDKVQYVINNVFDISTMNGLVLYDPQRDKTFYSNDLYDVDFVDIHIRKKELLDAISKNEQKLFRIRRLGFFDGEGDKALDYVVTLRKIKGMPFEERIKSFYGILEKSLIEGETLETYGKCFTVNSEHYEISFTLEAYKKNADRIGYISNGEPCTDVIKRMSCETAWDWAKKNLEYPPKQYGYCMYKTEMVKAFPNPADRFVKGISILKEARKEPQFFSYNDYYGTGEIYIKMVLTEYDNYVPEEISYLRISEDVALPLLQIIAEFYPYIWDRYYESNHLPAHMMIDIVERVKTVRNLIVNDTYSKELEPYSERIRDSLTYLFDYNEWKSIDKDYNLFLYKHRYEAVRVFDIFTEWIENQIETYGENYLHFNIEGP